MSRKIAATCIFAAFFIAPFSFLHADWADHIVISEIATTGSGSTANEIIEIYNPTSDPVDISKLRIQYLATTGSTYDTKLNMDEPAGTTVMQPYSYYLFCPADAPDPDIADKNWGSYFHMADKCTVRITLDSSGENFGDAYADKVAIGDTAQDGEGGTYAPSISGTADDRSIERKASSGSTQASMESGADEYEGNGEDSEDNSADFIIRTGRNPQNSSSESEPAPPPIPIDFAVADISSDGTLKISWTPDSWSSGTYDSYKIYRGLSEGNETSYTQTASSTTHEYWDAVAEGVTYYYKVSAVSTGARNNESSLTDPANAFSTDNTAPAMVTGLTALDTKKGRSIHLSWVPSSAQDLLMYKIGYKDALFGSAVWESGVSTYTIGVCSFTVVTGLSNGMEYWFRMSAIDWNGNEGAISNTTISATPTDIIPPNPVEMSYMSVTNEGSGSILDVSWNTYPHPDDLDFYKIYYSTYALSSPYDVTTSSFFSAVPGGTKNRSVTGLSEGTTYWFAVTGVDDSSNEKTLLPSGLYMKKGIPRDAPPQQITTLSALNEGSGEKIGLSWTASSESDVAGYNCYQAVYSSLTVSDYEYKCFVSTPLAARTMTGLSDGVTYYFGITAVDGASKEGVISSTVSAIATDTMPPSDSSGITVTRLLPPTAGGVLMLNWTNPPDADFDGTRVYSSTDGTSSVILSNLVVTLPKTTDYYCHSSLTNGLTHYYIIRPFDETGNESTSVAQHQGRPLDSYAPAQAQGFTGMDMGTGGAVHLSWTANSESDLRGYNIYRDSVSAAFISGATFYIDAAPFPAATYYYTIKAQDMSDNLSGPSSLSVFVNDVSVFPPYDISAAPLPTGRRVKLTWKIEGSSKEIWVYRGTADSTSAVFGVEPSTTLASPATFYFDTGLSDGTSYYYGIKAVNYVYESVVTKSTNTDTHPAFPYDSVAPAAPAGFKATLSFDTDRKGITLSWDKVTQNEGGSICDDLAGYEIEWRSEGGGEWGDNTESIDPGDTEWIHSNLAAVTWYYKIRAKDGSTPAHYSAFTSSISIYCADVLNYAFEVDEESAVSFTPNGDGIADSLDITFTLNQASTTVELRVYSSTGGFVASISSATYKTALSTSVTWSPEGFPDGTYTVAVYINGELFSSSFITLQGSAQIPPAANNYPNPFIISRDGFTKIRWRMASASPVKIAVYNTVGMLVKTWKISQNGLTSSGGNWYEHQWDGRNGKGRKVSSGIYICLIRGGGVDAKIKIAVIR